MREKTRHRPAPVSRQRRTVGAVLRIPLSGRWHCYAQTLPEADFAFFDLRTDKEIPVDEIVRRSVLFREAVIKSAWTTGRWRRVGKASLSRKLAKPVSKFIQDALDPSRFSVYLGGQIRPATRAECEGLQRCAVWDPRHIEDRLRDHYAGIPNKWVESLRIR